MEIPNTGKLDAKYSITVLIWLKNEGKRGIILKYNRKPRGFQMRMKNERELQVVVEDRTSTKTYKVSTSVRDIKYRVWNYIGFTYDGTTQMATILVDSKPVARRKIGKVRLDTRKEIRLGGYQGSSEYFRGRLFCLQLYSVALSRRQIEEAEKKCFLKGKMYCFVTDIVFVSVLSQFSYKVFKSTAFINMHSSLASKH